MTTTDALEMLWNYLTLPNDTGPFDALLVLGSYDLGVAVYAAQLYREGGASAIILSGSGTKHISDPLWEPFHGRPEAEVFADILREHGIPDNVIHVENQSQNTGENIHFTRKLLERGGLSFRAMRIVTKPYMTRRALATAQIAWPEIAWSVASEGGTVEAHLARSTHPERIIDFIVGDLERIIEYPKRGFSVPQDVPEDVLSAFEHLVQVGHTRCLVSQSV